MKGSWKNNRADLYRNTLAQRKSRGTRFEDQVASELTRRGHRVLKRNLRIDGIEVDLLLEAPSGGTICLVEVKYRSDAGRFDGPLVSWIQYKRLMRALSQLRRLYPGRQVFWALAFRNTRGDVEFVANPCYF
jgi:Holliday junction resolvase-like predicted endonuclease